MPEKRYPTILASLLWSQIKLNHSSIYSWQRLHISLLIISNIQIIGKQEQCISDHFSTNEHDMRILLINCDEQKKIHAAEDRQNERRI